MFWNKNLKNNPVGIAKKVIPRPPLVQGGVRLEFGQHVVFKRLVMRHQGEDKVGRVCLLLDGAPPPGGATGCDPIRQSYRSTNTEGTTVDIIWEDYQMQIGQGLNF